MLVAIAAMFHLSTVEAVFVGVRLRPGSHAFVVMANEPYLRVNLMASEFGTACGHPVLAAERSTLYAGWAAPTACITDCGLL